MAGGEIMRMRAALFVALLLGVLSGAFIGAGLVLAREDGGSAKVEAQDLFVEDFAGDPSKEVKAQLYTFPPGSILPWHIHPDADEIAYVIEGTFTFQRAGEQPKVMNQGEADYVAPNVVHHGMNLSDAPVKLFVVRIKPKDQPLTEEVPAPPQ
jgi:quercetin dioxygenase-like cupin family protein